jgi:hypothetical protein
MQIIVTINDPSQTIGPSIVTAECARGGYQAQVPSPGWQQHVPDPSWTATIPDPANPGKTLPNPVTRAPLVLNPAPRMIANTITPLAFTENALKHLILQRCAGYKVQQAGVTAQAQHDATVAAATITVAIVPDPAPAAPAPAAAAPATGA